MKLIVGLGNPGEKYLQTRHNIGFVVIDFILRELDLKMKSQKFDGLFIKTNDYIIAKPLTYMNLSGDFILKISKFYKVKTEDILIIYDDMDQDLGKYLIRKSGNSGGHNGIKDIMNKLNTINVNRIKIGIGRNEKSIDHVLGDFTMDEKLLMNNALRNCIDAAIKFTDPTVNIEYIMNKYNGRK